MLTILRFSPLFLFWFLILLEPLAAQTKTPFVPRAEFSVVLDPGHGGRDSVTRAKGHLEKDIVLNIAREVEKYLVARGMTVVMTRNRDEYISLSQRAAVAGDVFISLHANSVADSIGPSVRSMIKGIEIYTDRNMLDGKLVTKSKELSMHFSRQLSGLEGISFRAERQKTLAVLSRNSSPAILIELGYLSNDEDLSFLTQQRNYVKLAEAFFKALQEYRSQNHR
ncbi:N-acetylmuramoyl-L-alanine amidase [Pedobacter sp. SYSU D00535]|uniref:N-acetylmuramoyl-L-alanine amidase family protein n=1 Tax=Pedobacter sp. SYSU D00535 TaxID=2810308 RepID=UPI001A96200D|nr:N-acetylmuramoyl-L-alanine amidase [Pedobacter sp. SYSU D00535]